jgi:hypothetical protein
MLVVHGAITFFDHRSGSASTNAFDMAHRTDNPKRFRFNMRWNIGISVLLSAIWVTVAHDLVSK